jgi:hypothetical protein
VFESSVQSHSLTFYSKVYRLRIDLPASCLKYRMDSSCVMQRLNGIFHFWPFAVSVSRPCNGLKEVIAILLYLQLFFTRSFALRMEKQHVKILLRHDPPAPRVIKSV